jgi:hypothetical protein
VLDIGKGPTRLLENRNVLKAAGFREMSRCEFDLGITRKAGQRSIWQLNGGAAFGIGLDRIAGLNYGTGLAGHDGSAAVLHRDRWLEDGQRGRGVGGGLRGA